MLVRFVEKDEDHIYIMAFLILETIFVILCATAHHESITQEIVRAENYAPNVTGIEKV